jgi:hypothetical protein
MQDQQDSFHQLAPRQGGGELPYQPRVRRSRYSGGVAQDPYQYQSQQRGGENPPGMLALEDKLGQYAEGMSHITLS